MRNYHPVNFTHVTLTDRFWTERLDTVLETTIPSQHVKLETEGLLESLTPQDPMPPLRIPKNELGFTTQFFWDSDIGKWIEAASYALRHKRDETIEAQIDDIVDKYEAAQLPDGYLNLWYIGHELDQRWTNLRDRHELYNCGHLLEGAIAYFQATGKRKLLDVIERYLDHIRERFGTGPGQQPGYPGHQEIELALIKLYQLTGERKQLDLAAYFINQRGAEPHYYDIEARARGENPDDYLFGTHEYSQSHKPVRDQDKVVGHAVRAMYMYAGMADLAAELDDASLRDACKVLWRDVTRTRMYVTGGFGPSADNEGFTEDYDLPNDTAYAETCASVAVVLWAQRMLNMELDREYADVMERALYNGALSGLSREGTHYFYENKLESDGSHRRWDWHPCPCCTMNVSRLVASIGGYFYSHANDAVVVHLYGSNRATFELEHGQVEIEQNADFPWSDRVDVTVNPANPGVFDLKLRLPGWCHNPSVSVNGEPVDLEANTSGGYLSVRREWQAGDTVTLTLPMKTERVYAHPAVRQDAGRVAIQRGPLVYCAEQADNPGTNLFNARLDDAAPLRDSTSDMFDGIVTVKAEARVIDTEAWGGDLYRTERPTEKSTELTLIPYFLWANRAPGAMLVWLRS